MTTAADTGTGVPGERRSAFTGGPRRAWDWLRGALVHLTLAQRFALVCLVILVAGAVFIARLAGREIQSGVISQTSEVTALYVESFISPHLGGVENGTGLSEVDMTMLDSLIEGTAVGRQVVSFKVWSPDGTMLYHTGRTLIGSNFGPHDERDRVFQTGVVESHISTLDHTENDYERARWSTLVETYAPVAGSDGRIIAAVEFYQRPDDLMAEVSSAQRRMWLVVGGATVAMYLLLVGLVAGASRTITRQTGSLQRAFDQQVVLEGRIRGLNRRLRRAAGEKAETDEKVLARIAQDLHDGPAQDLALALLRMDTLAASASGQEELETLETMQFAVRHALEEVRDISTDMHLPRLQGLEWYDIVSKAVGEHRRRTGTRVELELEHPSAPPTQPQRIAAYRLVQEALSNASRHSGSEDLRVALRQEGTSVVITVEDHGIGFNVAAERRRARRRPALGLQGMRERIELLGGDFAIVSAPGKGTRVTARIPVVGAAP